MFIANFFRAAFQEARENLKPLGQKHPKIGTRMPDGSIYVGVSHDSTLSWLGIGKPLYAMPDDLPARPEMGSHESKGRFDKRTVSKLVSTQSFGGHTDWRLPTRGELYRMIRHRDRIGGFKRCWYWARTDEAGIGHYVTCPGEAQGSTGRWIRFYHMSVRCVRTG